MRSALGLAKRGFGLTSPNPIVGAVLVKNNKVIGQGWHQRAGGPHAEVAAIRDAESRQAKVAGATLYVTLEPCCTHGRTPPCTEAIQAAGIRRVVVGATDPNPAHAGKGLELLRRAGLQVASGVLAAEATCLNEAFNHWIVQRTPFVTIKAAMSLDGKIATVGGESKWITSAQSRACGMKLRQRADVILVGINTVLHDDPSLTRRDPRQNLKTQTSAKGRPLRRIILDSRARTPLTSRVVSDEFAALTTVVATESAPKKRVAALSKRVNVWVAPTRATGIDLRWLLKRLGAQEVTYLLVEGGGEVHGSFLLQRLAHRIALFYAPKIIGGRAAPKAVAGEGFTGLDEALRLREVKWRWLGPDLFLTARIADR